MSLVYILGTIGNILFGIKSIPQIVHCYKQKSTDGLSSLMIATDFGGNVLCAYFIWATTGFQLWPQFLNYFCATLALIILFIMMIIYRHK